MKQEDRDTAWPLMFLWEMPAAARMAWVHEAPLSCGSVQKFALTLHLFYTHPISMTQGAGESRHAGPGPLLKILPEALSFVLLCLLRCDSCWVSQQKTELHLPMMYLVLCYVANT